MIARSLMALPAIYFALSSPAAPADWVDVYTQTFNDIPAGTLTTSKHLPN